MTTLDLTESMIMQALGDFLTQALNGAYVVQGQQNQTPEPATPDYVVMWPVFRGRLATNVDGLNDVVFTSALAGNVLTVSAVERGPILLNSQLFGVGVAANTVILSQQSGPTGGVGAYTVSGAPQNVASEKMAAGWTDSMQETRVDIQLDVHGPASANNAQILSTLLRSESACDYFDGLSIALSPLYSEDPLQIPFVSGENQYEERWVVKAVLQANPIVSTAQQFADTLAGNVLPVDIAFPP